jgi:7,8-dihydropterin-6-yl-methyl-4-(beta-D-ribofuranosyl)aminobenzene 5'-phosphate synthase
MSTIVKSLAKSLRAVDRLEVWIVIDTTLDLLSTVPNSVTPELANLLGAGMKQLSPACLCCAAWGLSLVVTIHLGETQHTLLFDAGPETYAFERNIQRLGIDLSTIEAIVLSHGYFDHAGGLLQALQMIQTANGGKPVTVHVNPDCLSAEPSNSQRTGFCH